MIRMILAAILIFVLVYAGIEAFVRMTKREKMKLKKKLAISFGVAYISFTIILIVIYLF